MKLNPYLTIYTKIQSKLIKDLNSRAKTVKIEENIGENLHDIGVGYDFMDMTSKAQATQGKIDTWDYIKLNKLIQSKGNNQQSEKAAYGGSEIFANHRPDKGLISKMYKELLQLNSKKIQIT